MLDLVTQIRGDFAKLDGRAVFALIYAAFALTCISYLKEPSVLWVALSRTPLNWIGDEALYSQSNNIYSLLWWVTVSIFFYFVVPAIFVGYVQKRKLSEIGLAAKVEPHFLKLLGLCIAVMLPIVYLMSRTNSFASKYPFYHVYNGEPYVNSTLLLWELVYFLQFFGLEFFFRGFLVHSLKPSLGIYSILVMTIPYCMIHFQKPMPETFAAIFAGIFLGWISYKNGTIWLGLVLHCTVAFSMDILALHAKGLLF